ncbi:MAG TPA: TIGR02679 family protein [Acidimicrobiales bacterium]|nr:TIGR02679 family protein [Acidimicrobiales bacterium]
MTPLDRPELAPVWAELARRLGEGRPPVFITLRDLTSTQRRAVADLLGMDRLPKATARLRVDRLAAACGVSDLRPVVEERLGPISDRRAARLATQRLREELWTWFADAAVRLPLAAGAPSLIAPWVQSVRAAGIPAGDLDAHRRRLTRALTVLAALPADGIGLAALAADLLGDAHALDRGRPTAGYVLDSVAAVRGRQRATDAEGARLLWEEVGVVPDPLSSTVLILGLRPVDEGEPAVLTLSQLRRRPFPPLGRGGAAYVVENPALLSEAAAHGWAGPPLVCSSGRPSIAVVTLLRQLGAAGATLAQHADFDSGGLSITNWLAARARTTPWRMTAEDYLAAVAARRERVPVTGRLPPSPWDPGLHEAIAHHGVAVHEEEIRGELLSAICGDLRAPRE